MIVRGLALGDLATFASLTPTDAREILRTAALLRGRGETRDGWWFVGEEEGRVVARAAFWEQTGVPGAIHLYGFAAPRDAGAVPIGSGFLGECLRRMAARGARSVEARAYPDAAGGPEELRAVLSAAGFALTEEKDQHVREGPFALAEPAIGLRFRALSMSTEVEFVDAIRRVTEGTLDRGTRADVRRLGQEAAAQRLFDELRDTHFEPDWWLLAETTGVGLAGLVVPQRLGERFAAINYLGVVPECRGRRFGLALLLRAVSILVGAGLPRIVADIDVENAPLARALWAAGFRREFSFTVHRADLTSSP